MKHNWEYRRLGSFLKTTSGGTPLKGVSEYYDNGTIPWLRSGEVCKKEILDCEIYITQKAVDESSAKFIPANSVVMAMYGATAGQVGIIRQAMTTNQAICSIFPSPFYSQDFLYYYLSSMKDKLVEQAYGAAQPNISQTIIKSLYIPVPPMATQEQIVAELDQINDLIAKNRELLSQLDALAQSLFYNTFGDPISNPKEWSLKKLSDKCIDIVDGDHSAPPKVAKGVPFITISNIDKSRNSIDFSDSFFVPQSYYDGLKSNRKARNGDVLYTVTGSYGITVLIRNQPNFCFQRHIGLIRPKNTLNSVFLAHWGRSSAIKSYADKVATGIAQKTVSLTSLRNFPLILPPLALQEDFAAKVEAIEAQKAKVEAEIAQLQTLLEARMDYWFND